MNEKNIFKGNRDAWNEATEYHQRARKDYLRSGFESHDFATYGSDYDKIVVGKLKQMELSDKIIAHIQCNNGSELLSLMTFSAKEGVGFDISDNAISEARQLAHISKRNVKFVRSNILEIDEEYNGYFDFIFISEGSLQWIPNLNDYFRVVSRLLKKSGHVFISEMHPFVYLFENDDFDTKEMNFNKLTSYFKKGPYGYEDGIDYVGGVEYEAKECFWFMHKISDIINALLKNEIIIQEFNEYDIGNAGSDAENLFNGLPLSYILIGEKS